MYIWIFFTYRVDVECSSDVLLLGNKRQENFFVLYFASVTNARPMQKNISNYNSNLTEHF